MFDYKTAYENLLQKYKQQELEINRLRIQLAESIKDPIPPNPPVQEVMEGEVHRGSSTDQKLEFFLGFFHGRRDVFAVRWENEKTGKTGYSPSCKNDFDRFVCHKPKVKCSECNYQKFHPLSKELIRDHIQGKKTIGIYPMLLDETCTFLAIDLDKECWLEDAKAIRNTCLELGIFAAIERSRSGNGAHVWIFFEDPVSAAMARNLGTWILTRTMKKFRLSMDSYDRFFPNQDTLPRGGFGNLIALPFQGKPSSQGNSLFLDESMEPCEDQWLFLSRIKRLSKEKAEALVTNATDSGQLFDLGQFDHVNQKSEDEPWKKEKLVQPTIVSGPHPNSVRMVLSNQIYVEKKGLSPALIHRLVSLASFQNPEFYQAQAMRFSTYGIPRIICAAEEYPQHIGIPRGCLDEVIELLESHGIRADLTDERLLGDPITLKFLAELRPDQEKAAQELVSHETGVLSATTAFGKTVLGTWIIANRKVNTLVLVHRTQLLEQWKERIAHFLNIGVKEIGQIGGGKNKPKGIVDIALLQSLNRRGEVKELIQGYGQIIVDECHHLSAVSFEQILKQANAKFVLGLTATPTRKDGHHPIIFMQCGPIRHRVDARHQALNRPFEHVLLQRFTQFKLHVASEKPSIQDIYRSLMEDKQRNDLIFNDVVASVHEGRSPIMITERTQHVEEFAARLQPFVKNVIVLQGGMGKRQLEKVREQLASIPDEEERVIVATGRYIGEGFDDSRLDTLFLAMPISWKGTLQQYAGRLHRHHDHKQEVRIYDYIDEQVPVLKRMFDKRLKGYDAIGYQIKKLESSSTQISLF